MLVIKKGGETRVKETLVGPWCVPMVHNGAFSESSAGDLIVHSRDIQEFTQTLP